MKKQKHMEEAVTTKEKLIQAGIRLFSQYGYEATSTRMIANDVGVNMNTIQFHFGGKENLYKSVLEFAAKDCETIFEKLYQQIHAAEEIGSLDRESAWTFISKLIEIQLSFAIDQPKPAYLALLYWEQIQPLEGYMPMTEYAQIKCEEALAMLITAYRPELVSESSLVLSRFINGGIVSFGEHPVFLEMIQKKTTAKNFKKHIKKILYPFIMASIEQYAVKME